ncbi:hypothetical protein N799_03420 [Lysobacter arseniciresistens ZS79]|uniref:Uncharacterized protein n=1 Tax=Lysobacter arseniciresistens ZS79 TaxID=913325 RepID=A0A0A0F2M8_9GAMM|nr:hypothetical protein N799_03420 [Lysobacter arseniciresistens ZS79]
MLWRIRHRKHYLSPCLCCSFLGRIRAVRTCRFEGVIGRPHHIPRLRCVHDVVAAIACVDVGWMLRFTRRGIGRRSMDASR